MGQAASPLFLELADGFAGCPRNQAGDDADVRVLGDEARSSAVFAQVLRTARAGRAAEAVGDGHADSGLDRQCGQGRIAA